QTVRSIAAAYDTKVRGWLAASVFVGLMASMLATTLYATHLSRKAVWFLHSRRLDIVVLLVNNDDAAGIHQAVRDEAGHRRRDRDRIEVEVAAGVHETEQLLLLREEGPDDRRRDVAARGVEGRPRLHPPPRIGAERRDQQPAEEMRKQRHAFPDP